MKKYCCGLFVAVVSCLSVSCGDDDYHYPSVKQDFMTAFSGADGRLESVLTDEGETFQILERQACVRTRMHPFVLSPIMRRRSPVTVGFQA